ncbi:MAG TPA: flagellar hook-length control protein FliK [Dongiaceae bacterium]
MKRRAEEAQQELDAQRRAVAKSQKHNSDPVSGRPPQVTVSHPKTIRGQATRVDENAGHRLAQQSDSASDDAETKATGDASTKEGAAKGKVTEASQKAESAPSGDQPAQPAAAQPQPVDPAASAVVPVQVDQKAAPCAPETAAGGVALPTPVSQDGQPLLPTPGQQAERKNAATGEAPAGIKASPQQPAIAGAAATNDLSAALAALSTTEPSAAPGTDALPATPQAVVPNAPQPAEKQPLLQMPLAQAPTEGLVPPIRQQAARPAVETKAHSGTPTHASADTPDPAPAPSAAQPSAPANVATPVQPVDTAEPAGEGDGFDTGLSADGSAPGWALHLAQGAVGKRADFVNQLRQHLQNLPMQEQVAVHIQRAVREGAGRVSIQLSPAELGRIHVKLDIDEDKRVTASVTVERPSTLELLQRDVKGLERALHDAGLNMDAGDLSFSLGQSGDQDFAQDLGRSATSGPAALASDVRSEPDQPDSQVANVTDIAAGVVDVQV